jgi:hypothetical protein
MIFFLWRMMSGGIALSASAFVVHDVFVKHFNAFEALFQECVSRSLVKKSGLSVSPLSPIDSLAPMRAGTAM